MLYRSVTAWRKWYHGARGQSGPFKAEGAPLVAPTPLRREDVLDRYAQHVKSCPSCSKVCRHALTSLIHLRNTLMNKLSEGLTCTQCSAGVLPILHACQTRV